MSGEMYFPTADLYPAVLSGVFNDETSTMANPEAEDQEVMGEAPETSEVVSKEPRKMNLFLAIILIVVIVGFLGIE